MVLASASTGPMSWYAGRWEEFIADELPGFLAKRFHTRTDPAGTVLTGASMGGYGTLKIGLRHPDRFAAIAAIEPGIEPGFARALPLRRATPFTASPRSTRHSGAFRSTRHAGRRDNPANIARDNADAIRASGVEIYLEVGDEDGLNLHDGAEFMHSDAVGSRHPPRVPRGALGGSRRPEHQRARQ